MAPFLIQIGDDNAKPTPEMFTKASAFLQTMVNAQAECNASLQRRDGTRRRQRDTSIPYWRDNRVIGLRTADHRRALHEAKQDLADPESAENVRAGKRRRYTDRYGEYDL